MSTFLHRLSPETLSRIRDELIGQRFIDRDLACAALQCCNDCRFYGTLEERPLVVIPSENAKPGWVLVDAPQLEQESEGDVTKAEIDADHEQSEGFAAPDSAERDNPLI